MNVTKRAVMGGFLAGIVTAAAFPLLLESIPAAWAERMSSQCAKQPLAWKGSSTSSDSLYTVTYQQPACSSAEGYQVYQVYRSPSGIGVVYKR